MLSINTIVDAAINDMARGKESPHCGNAAKYNEIEYAEGYSEPGYEEPKSGILLANWNRYPNRLTDILEKLGYSIEWSDEWARCQECNKIIRISPDSYSWRRYYIIYDGSETCADCVKEDLDTYESYLLNNPNKADTFDVDWEARGFSKFNKDCYENGFHPHQNDNPKEIVKKLPKNLDYVFAIPSVGQFDVMFDLWIREKKEEE